MSLKMDGSKIGAKHITLDLEKFNQVKNHLIQEGKVGRGSTVAEIVRAAFNLVIERMIS